MSAELVHALTSSIGRQFHFLIVLGAKELAIKTKSSLSQLAALIVHV